MNKSDIESSTKNTLIQQCNYWLSEFKKLETNKKTNNNENLMIEALGCAKGNLYALIELDEENETLYDEFISDINYKLKNIYNDKKEFKEKYNTLLYNKLINNTLFGL